MPLSDLKCRNIRPGPKLQKLSDGGGLQLWVQPSGSRLWRLAYRYNGKQKVLALGTYPIISLAEAREARDDAKRILSAGIDPSEQRKKDAREARTTFRDVAEEYVAKLVQEGRAEGTISKIKWMLSLAYPILGEMNVDEVDAPAILAVLRTVEARGRYETANRLRSTIGSVLRYAMATARATSDPTLALKGALVRPPVTSYAAIIDSKDFGALLRAIDGFEGHPSTHAALRLMSLLFPRPGELRGAEWSEIDFEQEVWTVPPGRMKMRRKHRVPLSKQAIDNHKSPIRRLIQA